MGKKARRKREASEKPEQARQQAEAREKRRKQRRVLLVAVPLLTVALALVFWFVLESRFATGVTALLGVVAWIATMMAGLNEDIPKRDRDGAGRINFGR